MRRKLGYILLNAAIMIGVGATIGLTITKMDTDVSYGTGKELYFRLSEKNSTLDGVFPENYLGSKSGTKNYDTINKVAEEMEGRLANWGVNGTVSKEGYDLIKVTLRVEGDSDTEYNYLQNYLSFSGGHITVAAGTNDEDIQNDAPTGKEYLDNEMFRGQTAQIEYINESVPVVTIPVNYTGKDGKLGELINYCTENTKEADSSAGTEAKSCYLVLWSNFQEGDSYRIATSSDAETKNTNMAKRLIFGENAANAWYTDSSNEDNNYKKLQLVPNSEAIADGQYDSSKSGAAYKAAFYYMNLLNASSYQDDFDCDVSFMYSHRSVATVDSLLEAGAWHLSPSFGPSMIAFVASFAVLALVSALFYRLGALSILSNVLIAMLGGFGLFAYFHAPFGIGALVGFALGALVTAFGSIYYFTKFKEQLYEGRSPKKAHQEAIKKALWPSLGASISAIIIGLCVYGFVPSVIGAMGLSLILSSFFGGVANVLLLRLQGYLLAFDEGTEGKLSTLYGVDSKRIPNALNDEKRTYFGPYANKDFTKRKVPSFIVAGLLCLASIVGVSVFSSLGDAYNYSNTYADTTSISLEYRKLSADQENAEFKSVEDIETKFLPRIVYEGNDLLSYVKEEGIVSEMGYVYDTANTDAEETYCVYFFNIELNTYFDPTTEYTFVVNGVEETDLFDNVMARFAEDNEMTGSVNNVRVQVGTPTLGTMYLALGVSALACLLYSFLRFRPSRALAVSLLSLASSLVVAGFFSLTRLAVTPLANIALVSSSLLSLLLSSFVLNKEKEIRKDSREHEKESAAFRDACLVRANGESAGDTIVFGILSLGVLICFMGFATSVYAPVFLGAIVGLAVSLFFSLFVLSPLSLFFSKWLLLAKRSFEESRKKNKENVKPNSGNVPSSRRRAEPEEAIIIGIND